MRHLSKDTKKRIQLTIDWLREQVKKSNTKGLIVGVSGGIDSALVCYLIKKAFPKNSIGVVLPCKSEEKDREDALKVVQSCGIKYMEIDLTEAHHIIFEKVISSLKEKSADIPAHHLRLSDANLRARLRMSTIYSIANALNYLVVGTDNLAETFIGYFTKYGDGGVDIQPLAHLLKGEVKEWARELGVPREVIEKAPSAGLWEGQTDEHEIGTTYDMIDKYLDGKEIPQKDKEIILKLHDSSEHKRRMPSVPPKFK